MRSSPKGVNGNGDLAKPYEVELFPEPKTVEEDAMEEVIVGEQLTTDDWLARGRIEKGFDGFLSMQGRKRGRVRVHPGRSLFGSCGGGSGTVGRLLGTWAAVWRSRVDGSGLARRNTSFFNLFKIISNGIDLIQIKDGFVKF
jgi:hypothetical protein